eukprot:gene4397-7772_t
MTTDPTKQQILLNDLPNDSISSVSFTPSKKNLLLATCWDGSVRIYDVDNNIVLKKYQHKGAVLDGCWNSDSHCFTSGLDATIKMYDLENEKEIEIGKHSKAIRCLTFNNNRLYSGSWDETVKVWDIEKKECLHTFELPGKVYSMDISKDGKHLVVGTHGRHVYIYDLTTMKLIQKRESSLKYQTRIIRCFIDSKGYALSSIEGRVSIEYFDVDPSVQEKKYAFKCHRTKDEGVETLYPVNGIAFHPIYGSFATGGSDKIVNIWDGFNKKKLVSFSPYPTSISSLSFNYDGSLLAVASSYCFEKGEEEESTKNEIYVRRITNEKQVKPKTFL